MNIKQQQELFNNTATATASARANANGTTHDTHTAHTVYTPRTPVQRLTQPPTPQKHYTSTHLHLDVTHTRRPEGTDTNTAKNRHRATCHHTKKSMREFMGPRSRRRQCTELERGATEGSNLPFTRYCYNQCCMVYGIQREGWWGSRILPNSRAIVLQQ